VGRRDETGTDLGIASGVRDEIRHCYCCSQEIGCRKGEKVTLPYHNKKKKENFLFFFLKECFVQSI